MMTTLCGFDENQEELFGKIHPGERQPLPTSDLGVAFKKEEKKTTKAFKVLLT